MTGYAIVAAGVLVTLAYTVWEATAPLSVELPW